MNTRFLTSLKPPSCAIQLVLKIIHCSSYPNLHVVCSSPRVFVSAMLNLILISSILTCMPRYRIVINWWGGSELYLIESQNYTHITIFWWRHEKSLITDLLFVGKSKRTSRAQAQPKGLWGKTHPLLNTVKLPTKKPHGDTLIPRVARDQGPLLHF